VSSVWSALEGGVVGVAVGTAAADAIKPALEPERQDAWKNAPNRILDLRALAELVAQALESVDGVLDHAERNGYARDQLLAAIQLALKAPGVPEAERLYLRQQADPAGSITLAQLHHAYAKSGIEFQYWDALTKAAGTMLLSPAELALGIVRGTIHDPGLMVVTLDTADSNVPKYTPAQLDTLAEAAASGFNPERLRALVGSIGLPMSTHEAASAYFRKIITLGAYRQSILEGDVRPEWADPILEQAREILTAHDYAELELRGFYDRATRLARTGQHGMSDTDSDDLYNVLGRAIGVHAVQTALERGGTYPGSYADVPEPFRSALQRSNIRPEWASLAYANRYSFPSAFVIRALLKDGAYTAQQGEQDLLDIGWEPGRAKLVAEHYAKPAGATLSPEVKSQRTNLITDVRKQYLAGAATVAQVLTALQAVPLPQPDIDEMIRLWDIHRAFDQALAPPPPGPTT
jgi:hypothetical protein